MSAELPVIFIDDNKDIRRATAQLLELGGFTARVFPSGEQALAELSGSLRLRQ